MFTAKPIFNPEKNTLLLEIKGNLPDLILDGDLALKIERKGFEKRKELHITVLGFKSGKRIREALEKIPDKETIIEALIGMAENTEWTFDVNPERFHISKNERESIIQMVKLDGIDNFFDRLNGLLNTDIETPPPHITLYTKGVDERSGMSGIGINSQEEFEKLNPRPVIAQKPDKPAGAKVYTKIILPTRPQPDTIVAIFILKKFGEEIFPGIKTASVDFWQVPPEKETEESLDKKGIILIDLGGGRFDHHAIKPQTTASDLISSHLGVADDSALAKLLEYARRDDFFGKGTVSEDPIDRAFGLSSMIAVLNKSLVKNPAKVVELILPLLIAHYNEEVKRTKELPEEFEKKLSSGEAETFPVRQRDKKLKVVIVNSESGSLAGYLRSQNGGRFDVVAQWLPSSHVNILTRPTKRIDLRSLAALLRLEEATASGLDLTLSVRSLAGYGRIKEIPEWYYDPATNSIQNGGLNPKEINPTKIPRDKFKKIIELGLSEQLWSPREQY
ncbi:MAG: hypothetical protein A3B86_04360 [Candidatus Yanofskybacteria bacterium RIFCSPHIGHO2_02_FULL_38_22b]|uniref:Uncharacterized protein n=1 Tax=Candidatus Yanofskybacteria bacterium RIFCSPHIGHO2_02_FULL_38_22b TaxID=1802673 RepID=A0A1F8EZL2_9BACT|nr:MAG: hypothetical protein A2816_02130 [Candidatus Yanofskybacteria bacterium RIFCSPHIGHO2_01_FULL_39_44]OGN06321.1 MAG: hypothetical protein A3B86_04360 [Candidatus Yanofskybacteria bacterium RIFCSPHIGHO2_02_FULL_38_22b]OGN19740.1 MAG: hypothetical protein A2910_04095 [Candidatus Yanofskybacteria bacterium RIFCSPLOWO2_01_FULL_39_28]